MDAKRLEEIEARAAAVGSDTTLAKLLVITRQDIPDLVAALREAWAEIKRLENIVGTEAVRKAQEELDAALHALGYKLSSATKYGAVAHTNSPEFKPFYERIDRAKAALAAAKSEAFAKEPTE